MSVHDPVSLCAKWNGFIDHRPSQPTVQENHSLLFVLKAVSSVPLLLLCDNLLTAY